MSDNERLLESWKPEFRAQYEADERNAAQQSFDDYWGWITAFLVTGGAGQRGWLDQVDAALRKVTDEAAAKRLRARLLTVGRAIAGEWSKQGRYRRIYSTVLQGSPNLQGWGLRLQRATSREGGDGSAIEDALARIEDDVRTALGR